MPTKADIQFIRSLADRRARRESGLFVVEGPKMVGEALRSGLEVRRIFGSGEFAGSAPRQLFEETGRRELERMSSLRTSQGIVALVTMPRPRLPAAPGAELTLALDNVQDPGNLGTIVRSADWFGVRDVVCSPDTADIYNPKAVQSTMGSLFRVRVHYTDLEEYLRGADVAVYGALLDGENIYETVIEDPARGIVVMGNEGKGISPALTPLITRRIFIPPYPASAAGPESLNVAAATAVILSELRRRGR